MLLLLLALLPTIVKADHFNTTLITSHINKYRILHGANNVIYSNRLGEYAQNWSDYLVLNNKFEHSPYPFGENIAMIGVSSKTNESMIMQAIDLWYSEVKNYDYSNPVFKSATGHFTQVVWNSTREIGVGISKGNYMLIVMEFNPPGNYNGQFIANVFKPVVTTTLPPTPPKSPNPLTNITPIPFTTTPPPNPPEIIPAHPPLVDHAEFPSFSFIVSFLTFFATYFAFTIFIS